jgi:hypothetical protein
MMTDYEKRIYQTSQEAFPKDAELTYGEHKSRRVTASDNPNFHNGIGRFSIDKECESNNNGGKTDYYQITNAPFQINDFDDFSEWRGMNGNQFNMGKVMWTFNVGRHQGTDYERDLNKIIHYANRELKRIKR